MNRSLSLKREALSELTGDELAGVNGGGFDPTIVATVCAPLQSQVRCALSLSMCWHCE